MKNLVLAFFLLGAFVQNSFAATYAFTEFCAASYQKTQECPKESCQLKCADGSQAPECVKSCIPRECQTFSVDSCPKQFCLIATDCSQQKSCQAKMPAEQVPDCGVLGFSAQDVECCKGLVRRCGFDYLDGKCNMEGKNTSYSFPICIRCGDGVCTNFENHCNCPEDCKKEIIPLN